MRVRPLVRVEGGHKAVVQRRDAAEEKGDADEVEYESGVALVEDGRDVGALLERAVAEENGDRGESV
jgi:hypothetical protein